MLRFGQSRRCGGVWAARLTPDFAAVQSGLRLLGSALLADAALRVLKGDLKALALIVEAKDENAIEFYRYHGFQPFAGHPQSLFLPLGTARKAASSPD